MSCDGNRYNTGNDICSNNLKDLNDNAIIVDGYVNSDEHTVKDRFGIDRLTLTGIQNKADTAIVDFTGDAQTAIDGFEQLIDDKIIAQGGVEIAQDWGDPPSPDKVLSQEFLTSHVRDINLSITDFGASASASAEVNTSSIQSAIDYLATLTGRVKASIFIPRGIFNINYGITVPSNLVQLEVKGSGKYVSVLNITATEDEPVIRDMSYMATYRDFTISGAGVDTSKESNIGILVKRPHGSYADIDVNMINLRITGLYYATETWGRGLVTDNCDFNTCNWGVNLNFPNVGDYIEGDQPVQKDNTGYRNFIFRGNRYHSNRGGGIKNDGANAKKIQTMLIVNNTMDIGRTLFKGVFRRSLSSSNIISQSPQEGYLLEDGSEDYIIDGDYISGNIDSNRVPTNFIKLTGAHKNYKISNMYLKNCRNHGIDIRGDNHVGGTFSNIYFKNPCITGGDYSPFVVVGSNNQIRVESVTYDTQLPLKGVVRNSNSSNNILVDNTYAVSTKIPLGVGSAVMPSSSDVGLNEEGTFINLYRNGSVFGSVGFGIAGTGGLSLNSNGSLILNPLQGSVRPPSNGEVVLGNSLYTFRDLFLLNQPTVTSDANAKIDIDDIDEKYIRVMSRLNFKQFKLKSGTSGRTHFGIIAQEWIAACEAEGVDPKESGVLVGDEKSGYAIRYNELQILFNAYILSKLNSPL